MATTPIYVIDTHTLIGYFTDSPKLSQAAKQALNQVEQGNALGVVPTIVLAEIVHLAGNKKIPISAEETIARLQQATSFGIISLDLMVVLLMIPLNYYELHDRVIVATAKSFGASVITKDEQIHKSGTVPCIW